MRLVRRMLLAVLALAAALLGVRVVDEAFPGFASSRALDSDVPAVRVYVLAPGSTLDFDVAPPRHRVKLLLNATLADVPPGAELGNAYYAVHYTVLDAAGAVLEERTYHHRLQLGWRLGPEGDRVSRRYLGAQRELVPSYTSLMYLDLGGLRDARMLRLAVGPASHTITAIAVRPYAEEAREDDPERRWLRLHQDARAKIAKANVFDADLLTQAERENLLQHRWRPLVPVGVETEDYVTDLLYDTGEDQVPPVGEPSPNDALVASPGHSLTFPVMARSNTLAFEFTSLDGNLPAADAVTVRWYGRTQREYREARPSGVAREARLELSVPRGLVEISATARVRVRAIDTASDVPMEPLRFVVPLYGLSDGAVEFDVHHEPGTPTPIRLDLRMHPALQPEARAEVRYVGFDRAGNARVEGTIAVSAATSSYDVLLTAGDEASISVPTRRFLHVPADVERLRLEGGDGVFVTLYNRPDPLLRSVEIPESLFGGGSASELRPAWFILAPRDESALRAAGRLAYAETQVPPPDVAFEALADAYDADRLAPHGDYAGHLLLEPRIDTRPVRNAARATTYVPLPLGSEAVYSLESTRRDGRVLSSLVFLQAEPEAQTILLTVDARPFARLPIRGRSGRIAIPPLPQGDVRIAASARPRTMLYLSHAQPRIRTGAGLYREQLVHPLSSGLTFDLDRRYQQDESLSVRIYGDAPARAVLELSIEPFRREIGEHGGWTFERARYDVLLEPDTPVPAVDGSSARFDHLGYFFHALQSDMPAGEYRVRLRQIEGPRVLVSVVRFAAGEIDASEVTIRTRAVDS